MQGSNDSASLDATLRATTDGEGDGDDGGVDLEARSIGRFAVLRKLGEGGMGVVYAAFDERLARRVAIKLLRSGDHARLVREAQALARLSHPNVTQVYEVGEALGRVFVAMEYVEGPTLSTWLATPHPASDILAVFLQAGEGLAAAHASGLVHRDFKPGNVIVADDGRARVLDFGLARAGDSLVDGAVPGTPSTSVLSSLTMTGTLLGTPAYMSPEQHAALPVDARSDQFGFCAALYEALYDQRPFAGDTLPELAKNLLLGNLRPPRPRADVPPEVHAAIVRGLAADPDRRWPAMQELLAVLRLGHRQSVVVGDPRVGRWIGVGALVIGGSALAAVSLLWERPEEVTPADNVRLAVISLIAGAAGAPWLLRKFPRRRGRQLIGIAMVFLLTSLITRVAFWAADASILEAVVGETLVFMTINATLIVALRLPWLLINVVMLLAALVIVLGFGVSPYLLGGSWVVAIVLGSVVWRRLWPAED